MKKLTFTTSILSIPPLLTIILWLRVPFYSCRLSVQFRYIMHQISKDVLQILTPCLHQATRLAHRLLRTSPATRHHQLLRHLSPNTHQCQPTLTVIFESDTSQKLNLQLSTSQNVQCRSRGAPAQRKRSHQFLLHTSPFGRTSAAAAQHYSKTLNRNWKPCRRRKLQLRTTPATSNFYKGSKPWKNLFVIITSSLKTDFTKPRRWIFPRYT